MVSADLADAFRTGTAYLSSAVHSLIGTHATLGQEAVSGSAAGVATVASRRLDVAFRVYLAEQGTKLVHRDELAALVGGATRVLLTANSLATLPLRQRGGTKNDELFLDGELHSLTTALDGIADDLSTSSTTPPSDRAPEVSRCTRIGVRAMDSSPPAALAGGYRPTVSKPLPSFGQGC